MTLFLFLILTYLRLFLFSHSQTPLFYDYSFLSTNHTPSSSIHHFHSIYPFSCRKQKHSIAWSPNWMKEFFKLSTILDLKRWPLSSPLLFRSSCPTRMSMSKPALVPEKLLLFWFLPLRSFYVTRTLWMVVRSVVLSSHPQENLPLRPILLRRTF